MIKIGSLFSGIGGLELGLERATEGKVVWQAECDKYCLTVLARHWPDAVRYINVTEVAGETEYVDIICGGFPCQPHSTAGKRKGITDDRWLWPEFQRIIACKRPGVVFIENVPGLSTSGLRNVLSDLAKIGYNAVWDCYTAEETGAPHKRERLFILSYPNSDGLEKDSYQNVLRNQARLRQSSVVGTEEQRQGLWAT